MARTGIPSLRRSGAALLAIAGALALTSCGYGGGYGGGGGGTYMTGAAASKLFVADSPHFTIGSVANPNPAAGVLVVDRAIYGGSTGLSNNIGSLALDTANDRLYIGNGTSILVFNGASMANGNVVPNRTITNSPASGNTGSLFLDQTNNRLYVGDDVVGVRVFNNAATINGATASDRLISGDFGTTFQIHGVAVDAAKNILYVSDDTLMPSGSHQISVFDSASTVNGSVTPNRTITPTVSSTAQNVGGIFLDAVNDRLYVAGGSVNTLIMEFDNASTANGTIAPTRTLTMPAVIANVVVDTANNRLYGISPNAIYIVNNASAASGTVIATSVLTPAGGQYTALAAGP